MAAVATGAAAREEAMGEVEGVLRDERLGALALRRARRRAEAAEEVVEEGGAGERQLEARSAVTD